MYGGASDIRTLQDGDLVISERDTEITMEIRFESNSLVSDFDVTTTNSDFDPGYKRGFSPHTLTQDSLVVVVREGKYQVDYELEKADEEIDGIIEVFERDSEGNSRLVTEYTFNVQKIRDFENTE
jgi:hypothetical protein